MIHAIILSGGAGIRFGEKTPKQYINICNKPIIGYSLDVFQQNSKIDTITIVISEEWKKYVGSYLNDNKITKFIGFADSGISRQHSILSGMEKIHMLYPNSEDYVVIHDAARPCVEDRIISDCVETLEYYDMSMPVVPIKDTIYYSNTGKTISNILNRDCLYAGQTPEGCHLGTYLEINRKMSNEELLLIRGTCEAGYKSGLSVGMFKGDEGNYKITVPHDLENFKMKIEEEKHESV